MNQYGAHILATIRRTEFAAEATASRRAAALRERQADQPRPAATDRPAPARQPVTA